MKKTVIWISAAAAIAVIFTGVYFLYSFLSNKYSAQNMDGGGQQEQEYFVPDFTARDNNNNDVKLSDYFGKPIVLNFWASWCPPCKAEMPHFESAYKQNPDIQFLMVNMTDGDRETMAAAKQFIAEQQYTFNVLFDTEGQAAAAYGAYSLPVTFFIDSKGKLVTYAVGMLSAEQLDTGINMLKE